MIIYIVLGIITGTITGLIPGLHSNNIIYFFTSISFFQNDLIYFVISMVITQSFVDFIPSIYFGAPETSTFEGVLPGHKLFLKGEGFLAITLTVFGGLIAISSSIIFIFIFQRFISINKDNIIYLIPVVLIISSIILIFSEENNSKKIISLFVFLIAGSQGIIFKDQIFPLISGYFGISTILMQNKNNHLIEQKNNIKIEKDNIFDGITGVFGGMFVSIFPGIGSNLAAAIIKLFRKNIDSKKYLIVLGSINTSNFLFSIPVLFILDRARNGAAIFLKENFLASNNTYFFIFITIIISASAGALLTIKISKYLSNNIKNINFEKVSYIVIICIFILVYFNNGLFGILALFFSTALGLIVITTKVEGSNCLGALIIPTLFFYLFILI